MKDDRLCTCGIFTGTRFVLIIRTAHHQPTNSHCNQIHNLVVLINIISVFVLRQQSKYEIWSQLNKYYVQQSLWNFWAADKIMICNHIIVRKNE